MFCYENDHDLMELWVQTDEHCKFKGSLENCTVQLPFIHLYCTRQLFMLAWKVIRYSLALFWIKLDVKLFSISCRISKSILTVAREKWMQQLWRCCCILNYCTIYSHVINIINAGLKKSPIQSSRESRFSCEASNFSSVLTCSTMGKDPGKSSSS